MSAEQKNVIVPVIGAIWPSQGGIYAGVYQDGGEMYHLIFAEKDAGKHAWGEYGVGTDATSETNGFQNTAILLSGNGLFPAAQAAHGYSADGHHDFYLPCIGELSQAWQSIAASLDRGWYWSSTQRSAHNAFFMDFDDGTQSPYGEGAAFFVRPARRFPAH